MFNQLSVVKWDGQDTGMIQDERGNRWWVARDLCRILEIENPDWALSLLDWFEKDTISLSTPWGTQETVVVNESGLYRLVFQSGNHKALQFQGWIFSNVLPQIAKMVWDIPVHLYYQRALGIVLELKRSKYDPEEPELDDECSGGYTMAEVAEAVGMDEASLLAFLEEKDTFGVV
jgi:hypothetical protein